MKNTDKTTETTEKKAVTLTKEELRRKVVRVASSVRAGVKADQGGGDV